MAGWRVNCNKYAKPELDQILAASQGQRIYHLTKTNQADVLPKLRLDGLALQEISQGLASGREVIAHTDRINVSGWTGEGYIIYDPYTGSGAYKITGGSNGGWGYLVAATVFGVLAITFLVMFGLPGILAWGWMLGWMGMMINELFKHYPDTKYDKSVFLSARLIGFIIAIFVFGSVAFTVFTWISLIAIMIQGLAQIIQSFAMVRIWRRMPA